MTDLVTVKKTGQPTLRILRSSLDQHVKLGWRHVEDEVIESPKADSKSDLQEQKTDQKTLRVKQ